MVADRETYILISDEGLFPAEFIYPSDDLFPEDPSLRQVSNIVAGSLKLDELIAEKVPQFGQMFATKFECTVYLEEDLAGKFIHVYQVVNGVSRDVFAGKIDSCKLDKVGTDRKLIAYDLAYEKGQQNIAQWWERFWTGKTSATIKQIRESLLNSASIVHENVELPNDNLVVHKTVTLTSCTMTAMLRMLCELNYCFPHMGRDGLMQFIMLNTEPEEIKDISGLYEGMNSTFEDFVTAPITGVQFYDSGSELKYTWGDTTNAYPIKQNIFLYDQPTSVLDAIGSSLLDYLSDFSYTPSTVKMIIGEMSLQLGDFVHTEKGDFYVTENSYSGSQFFEQTIKAQGQESLYGGTQNFDYNAIILSEKIARVKQSVEAFEVEYADFKEQTESNFVVTADSISAEVTRARNAENALSSQIQQTAESISLSVTNSSTSSTIKLMLGQTELSSKVIQMNGLVTFTDLAQEGETAINGSNIITGTIDAWKVGVTHLNADSITSGTITISDAGSHVTAFRVLKDGEQLVKIDANDGVVVGRDVEGQNRTVIYKSGLAIFNSGRNQRIDLSHGNIECTQTLTCNNATVSNRVTCKDISVNNSVFTKKTVTTFNNVNRIAEVKAFAIDTYSDLWAVESSVRPSMKGNTTNGYVFSTNPTWKKISLKEVSYTNKIYGMIGSGSVTATNRTLLGSW